MIAQRHTGLAVRAMVRGDLAAIGFMMFTLLVVALAIDLAKWLGSVQAQAQATDASLISVLLPYIGYRSVDIVTRLLTMACLAGGFVVTLLRHQRQDDVILAAAGAGPSFRIAALLISGLLLGGLQMAGENWLRPEAVAGQVAANLGDYGKRYNETDMGTQWVIDDTRALRATLTRGENPKLNDVMLFDGLTEPKLTNVLHARAAHPSFDEGVWTFEDVTVWDVANASAPSAEPRLDMPFNLDPETVRWFGVDAYYLPNHALRAIATAPDDAASSDAATALAVRKVAIFLPAIFALLGVSLASQGTVGRRLSPFLLLALAAIGYLAVVSVKVFWALGIHGVLPPLLAATLPAVFAFGLACLLQLRLSGYLPRLPRKHLPKVTP
ncbi:LptF/LptG family permease [Shimia sp. R10_1]|uniref:LptF/LptG family permease n=1 Tax=Shimia sp. R10_1 TaxID=2821095 RepID=UPI001ADBA781|nr:LptF/LptG family permease [Shimia sp. R10_1]MBO9473849.1 LptF/LptG family permease [Shimia sp. R10_1]